jgi:prevent-host-death family protein
MQDVPIFEFKAKCLEFIKQVRKTRQRLRITHHGQPVAEIAPAGLARNEQFVGDMVGTGKITGDIVSPVLSLGDIEHRGE